jgi:plasmid maintenance system killer protein
MKITFSDEKLEEFCTTGKSDKNEYSCYVRDARFMSGLRRCLTTLLMAQDTVSLKNYSFLHYEQLKDNLGGLSSVRICNGRVERLLFAEKENGVEIRVIELNTKHYGSKK